MFHTCGLVPGRCKATIVQCFTTCRWRRFSSLTTIGSSDWRCSAFCLGSMTGIALACSDSCKTMPHAHHSRLAVFLLGLASSCVRVHVFVSDHCRYRCMQPPCLKADLFIPIKRCSAFCLGRDDRDSSSLFRFIQDYAAALFVSLAVAHLWACSVSRSAGLHVFASDQCR